jgi:hypothetical protein
MAEEVGNSTSSTVPLRYIAVHVSGDVINVEGDEPNTTKELDLASAFFDQVNDPENKSLFHVVEKAAFADKVTDDVTIGKAC